MSTPASVAIVGAGDFIGAAIARRFAAAGFSVHGGRRQGEKLASLKAEIEAAGGKFTGHTLDARTEESVSAFLDAADKDAPLQPGEKRVVTIDATDAAWEVERLVSFLVR